MVLRSFGRSVAALGRHVWLVLALNFLASFAYHMMSVLLVLYATDEFGLSDVDAGLLYSWWGIISSLWAGALCFVIDVTGVKRSAVMGTLIICCTRVTLLLTHDVSTLRWTLLGVSPIAEGLLAPVYMVGIKQLTREEQRAMAYGLNYACHNAGGGFADIAIDVVRGFYRSDPQRFRSRLGRVATPARACLLLSEAALFCGACLACALPSSLAPPILQAYKHFHDEDEEDPQKSPPEELCKGAGSGVSWRRRAREVARDRLELLRDRKLLAVALISTCLTGTKSQWHHMNATMPKYLVRELGEDTPWGSVNSINYWMCTLLPPVVAALTGHWSELPCIIVGSFVMAAAPIFMVLDISVLATCAWLTVMSVGEVIWNPRFTSFTANLSPPGREGAFLVLAYTPQFLAGLPSGWLSGKLLEWYCPDCPECRDTDTGAFCRKDCSSDAAACAAADGAPAAAGGARCFSGTGAGSCLERDWGPSLSRCPSSCTECPGWSSREDGRLLWFWIFVSAIVGPVLLLVLRPFLSRGMKDLPAKQPGGAALAEAELGDHAAGRGGCVAAQDAGSTSQPAGRVHLEAGEAAGGDRSAPRPSVIGGSSHFSS